MLTRSLRRIPLLLLGLPIVAAATGSCSSPRERDATGVASSSVTREDPLVQVRIRVRDSDSESRRLLDQGYDVLEGSERADSLEIIGTPLEIDQLRGLGYEPEMIAVGGPLAQSATDALEYPTLAQMHTRMREIEAAHPELAKVVDITEKYGVPATSEGRHLLALKVSARVAQEEDEPTYLLVSNHHARELGPPVVAMLAMDKLTSQYATDARIKAVVDSMELWIAPTWNPDGLEHVHNVNNMWRKNRRPNSGGSFGVDLNRNYPFLWSSSCTGSTSPSSDTYKGPSAGSEPETQTMVAFSSERRFTKVLDFHSSGREVLVDYACSTYALRQFFSATGTELANRMGYQGATRRHSAQGEHPDWQLGNLSNLAFLVEINTSFQPPDSSAQAEAEQLWPGILWHMERPTPVSGHVTDAETGAGMTANVVIREIAFTNGEKNSSGGPFGRYQAYVPAGSYTVDFSAEGYATQTKTIEVTAEGETKVDVALSRP